MNRGRPGRPGYRKGRGDRHRPAYRAVHLPRRPRGPPLVTSRAARQAAASVGGPMNPRKAASVVSTMVVAIMLTGFATSYVTLAEFLHRYQVETWASWTIPFTIDLLAIAATISRHVL